MADSLGLASQTRLKTNPIAANCMGILKEKKSSKVFIAHSKGVHMYDSGTRAFEDVKFYLSGAVTCLSESDDVVFFCSGMQVLAAGSNARVIYQTETFLAVDRIEAVHVYGYRLWLVAGNMISEFLIGGTQIANHASRNTAPQMKTEDVSNHMFDVRINHSVLIKIDTEKPFLLLLKNNNQVETFEKKSQATLSLPSPPVFAYTYPSGSQGRVLVGTTSGEVFYLSVERKSIKQIWKIQGKGRINCIVEVKSGFLLCRDQRMELYGKDRELLGAQETSDKVTSAVYLPEDELVVLGTASGNITELYDYEKMMKLAKQRDEAKERALLIKEIEVLRGIKADLKSKAALRPVNSTVPQVKITSSLSLDYTRIGYCLELTSEQPILKLVLNGDISLLASNGVIHYQGVEKNSKVYVLQIEASRSYSLRFYFKECAHENEKLNVTVVTENEQMSATMLSIDLKHLSLQEKIESYVFDGKGANVLRVTGDFKYFMMNLWISSIFADFSPSQDGDSLTSTCYQSIVTKAKVLLQVKDKFCEVRAESASVLAVVKKILIWKAKEKQISLNFDSRLQPASLQELLSRVGVRMRTLMQVNKQYELLPALAQISGETLSEDLQSILNNAQQLKKAYDEQCRQFQELKTATIDVCASYSRLGGQTVIEMELKELDSLVEKYDQEGLFKFATKK